MQWGNVLLIFISGIEFSSLKESLDGAYLAQPGKLHDILVER